MHIHNSTEGNREWLICTKSTFPQSPPPYKDKPLTVCCLYGYSMLLSHFSRVRLCATPQTAAHQAPLSLGFSRQEHWSGLPFPSPMHESEKWNSSHSVVPDSWRPHGLQPTRLLRPWDFPGKSTGVGCHCLLWQYRQSYFIKYDPYFLSWLARNG